ncbi:MAG: hypothetical protein MK212_11980 [Saprospiraceae bacterium]|nr:hypothetical protein [Saprospiraceae bacterium]
MTDFEKKFEEKLKTLRIQIQSFIDKCDSNLTPKLCQFRSTDQGREKLAQYIEDKILQAGLSILEAMLEIEREFNHNIID